MEQMQRIIGQNINYNKKQSNSKEDSLENMQEYMINTPHSNLSNDKYGKKQMLNEHHNQI